MIVDCHTHIWENADQLGPVPASRVAKGSYKPGSAYDHLLACQPVDLCFVLGFKSNLLGTEIPNELIADYCSQHRDKLLGFGAVDPTDADLAEAQLEHLRNDLKFVGLVISPVAQAFHPTDTRAMRVYQYAQTHSMPVIIHYGQPFGLPAMEFGPPRLLEALAREFPDLKILISQMANPWIEECAMLLAEHENIYADISGLIDHPWTLYRALMIAQHTGTLDKLLFGSDYPVGTSAAGIETLYSINQLASGTNLPTIARPKLVGIVQRDVLELLALPSQGSTAATQPVSAADEDD